MYTQPNATSVAGLGTPSWAIGGNPFTLEDGAGTNAEWSGSPAGGPGQTASWQDPGVTTDLSTSVGHADLTQATAVTINALREAFQVQRLFERDARGGTRYTEILRSHFGGL